jgi:hypothetical protein
MQETQPESISNQVVAKREKATQFVGVGCLIQAIGLPAPFIGLLAGVPGFIAGLILMLILFFVGSSKSVSWRCGNCKNPIANAQVKLCPTCKAQLK